MSPSGSGYYGFHGPKEIWNYWGLPNPRLPYNLEFVFVDRLGTGNFALERSVRLGDAGPQNINIDSRHFYFDYLETLAEATKNPFEGLNRLKGIITTQVTYDRIPIDYNLYHLKASEEKTYIFLAVKTPYSAVTQKEIENENYFNLTLLINVSDRLGGIIYERSKDINFKHTREELEALKGESFQIQTSISLEPEDYKIHFLVLDNFSGKIGTLHSNLSIPKFSSESLITSDIILSPEKKSEAKEVPSLDEKMPAEINQIFHPGEEMSVYFEVYNLAVHPDSGANDFKVEYIFLQNGKALARVPSPEIEPTKEKDCRVQTSFRLKNFNPGEYILRVKIIDSHSGVVTAKETRFTITH